MRPRAWLVIVVAAAAGSFVSGILLGGYVTQPADAVPVEEVEFGADSGFNFDSSFEGGCLTISDGDVWEAFWEVHKSRRQSPDPTPFVDFARNAVLACFLGWQGNAGDSIKVERVIAREGGGYWVFVERDVSLLGLGVPVNPYHIVKVPDPNGPSLFLDNATGELLPGLTLVP